MPTHMTSRLENALVFAAQLHREQWRKGSNVPYVSHLLAVSALVIEHGGDEDEAIAALLHDAIEDQGGPKTRDEILRRFGERVSASTHPVRSDAACGRIGAGRRRNRAARGQATLRPWFGPVGSEKTEAAVEAEEGIAGPVRPGRCSVTRPGKLGV